jgi:hypothetical protein
MTCEADSFDFLSQFVEVRRRCAGENLCVWWMLFSDCPIDLRVCVLKYNSPAGR